ncbi:hypothetical protein QTJ16_000384 [Diplocarpon rosae]|uniref:Uncharacterized protein n=1 Tax=Diplocarpon rosae TaxID=946125 RepID=A0AAD9T6D5_9HELO|nr:hypothetical protein QTJ16_000384 [Diplocarpon rosae]PBP16418.1 hypothetical protein BUE80_DR012871 [Diplocarpon rosae]
MVSTYIIITGVVAFIAAALGAAYTAGALDPVIKEIGIFFFKAKAEAERKKWQAQGMKEGQDFVSDSLKGNEQANEVANSLGDVGGLKKAL